MKQQIKVGAENPCATYQNILDYKIGMKLPDKITVLYSRLSRDDKEKAKDDDSNSIVNQKKMLAKFATDNHLANAIFFTDDGISGTTFDRPDFQVALELVEAGRVTNFVVKDMSRFGRDYVRVGFYTENVFPDMNVRFLAINDSVDSATGENEIIPFKNILNEWYARDTSKKVRAVFRAKGMAGESIATNIPYGYMKDPANPKHWIVDEPASKVVQRIFQYCMDGLGVTHIANQLRKAEIEVPTVHACNAGYRKSGRTFNPYDWHNTTVARILERREYLGHTINFKTYRKSYKNRKKLANDPSEHVIFENTHEAIIKEEVFEKVQQIRKSGKKRRDHSGRISILSGLVYCADCKSRMYLSSGACLKPEQDNYTCSGFRTKKAQCNSAHFIRRVVLEQLVLEYIQMITAYASEHEKAFIEKLESLRTDKFQKDLATDKKCLAQSERRIQELDNIIRQLYEDKVAGTLTDERFLKLSQGYELEQKDLEIKVETLQRQMNQQLETCINIDKFLAKVRKYTRITELSTIMLNELIERIEVHNRNKRYSKGTQQIDISFNYVGNIGELFLPYSPPA